MKRHNIQEKIVFQRPAETPQVEVLLASGCSRLWKWFHETYTVCTILPKNIGYSQISYRSQQYISCAGRLLIQEPGEIHSTDKVVGAGDFGVLFVDPSFVQSIGHEIKTPSVPHLATGAISDPRVYRLFVKLLESFQIKESRLEIQSRLTHSLGTLLCRTAEGRPRLPQSLSSPALFKIRDYLIEHYAEQTSLDDLVVLSGLNRFHLIRSFSQKFGLPPHAFQSQVRIAKAARLISKGMFSPGVDLGFCDQSHFIRHFKRVMGVTPGQYSAMVHPRFISA